MQKTLNARILTLLLSLILIFTLYGLGVILYHWSPYQLVRDSFQDFRSASHSRIFARYFPDLAYDPPNDVLIACEIDSISAIPSEATVIIGHAYGTSKKAEKRLPDNFLAPKIVAFLDKYSDRIDTLILTGDVFYRSSHRGFERLRKRYQESFQIAIAPGNHDRLEDVDGSIGPGFRVARANASVILPGTNYIVEDSVANNWLLDKSTIRALNASRYQKNFLFRHNIPINELLWAANSRAEMSSKLPKAAEFFSRLNERRDLVVISGDGGVGKSRPRLACLKFNKMTLVVNGIGEILGDTVLVISDDKLFSYNLDIFMFEEYVDSYPDLLNAHISANTAQTKSEFGRWHYFAHGKIEGRVLPVR